MTSTAPARVPQEERSRAMRNRLLEATVELLAERGWSGTTTTLVSKRAGVSRGAQLHHFPTKNDLVLAAVEHLSDVRGRELASAASCLPDGGRRTRAVLDMLADHFTGQVFTAALELWVAARTDPILLESVAPLEQRIGRETHRLTVDLLGVDERRPGAREMVQATLDLVRGLGLANTISDDTARRSRILDEWARTLDARLPRSTSPGRGVARVVDDLVAEGDLLDRLVSGLPTEGWRTPTPAAGWDVAHQIAHLAWTDEVASKAATDKAAWDAVVLQALEDPDGFVDAGAGRLAALEPAQLLARWRAGRTALAETLRQLPAETRIPWFGPPMSATSMATARFMETWAHGLDVAEALDASPSVSDRIRHVVHLGVRTRDFAFRTRGMQPPAEEFRVELTGPGGETWEYGPEQAAQSVRGPAYDFCLLVTRRRHRDDLALVAHGPDADRWLDIAQAFAGPPGADPEPKGPLA